MRALPLALLTVLLAPLVLPGAAAALPLKDPLLVSYTAKVRVDPATPEKVAVEVTMTPAAAAFTQLELFAPATVGGSPALLALEGPSTLKVENGRWRFNDGLPEELRVKYSFNPRVTRGSAGADLTLTADFGLLKLESLLPRVARVEYSSGGGTGGHGGLVRWEGRVEFDLPAGWSLAGPTGATPGKVLSIPAPPSGLPEISGYVLAGKLSVESHTYHGLRVDVVSVPGGIPWTGFPAYVEDAVPYLRATFGPTVRDHVVAMALPTPAMRRGGAALGHATFWASDASPQVWAHEFTHLWQAWPASDTPGGADVWLKEGGADWHGALSLRHAGVWTQAQVEQFVSEKRRGLERETATQGALRDADYGSDHEEAAYAKGMHLIADMESSLVAAGNPRGLLDLYRSLARIDGNGGAMAAVHAFLGAAGWPGGLHARFDRAVNQTGVPPAVVWTDRPRPVVVEPILTPDPPVPGKAVALRVPTLNLGRSSGRVEGPLEWSGGKETAPLGWMLQPGEVREATLAIASVPSGTHFVESPAGRVPFLVPAPPEVTVADVRVSEPLREGSPFVITVDVENRGDQEAAFEFPLVYDGRTLTTQPWRLEARASHTFTYEAGSYSRSNHTLEVGDHEPVSFTVTAPARIVVTRIEIPSPRVRPDTPFEVLLTVTNTGTEAGEDNLTIRVDRERVGPVHVTLKGGETRLVRFTPVVSGEGTHEVRVEGFSPIAITAEKAFFTPFPWALAVAAVVLVALARRRS